MDRLALVLNHPAFHGVVVTPEAFRRWYGLPGVDADDVDARGDQFYALAGAGRRSKALRLRNDPRFMY